MKPQTRTRHAIHLIFPISLLFVFAASALIVLMLSADLYASATDRLMANDQGRTALSYISEKVRQGDKEGALGSADIEGITLLSLSSEYGGEAYVTYIYEYEGMLKELFIKEGAPIPLKNGSDIIEISSFTVEPLYAHVYRLTVVDSEGFESSMVISERSAR